MLILFVSSIFLVINKVDVGKMEEDKILLFCIKQ